MFKCFTLRAALMRLFVASYHVSAEIRKSFEPTPGSLVMKFLFGDGKSFAILTGEWVLMESRSGEGESDSAVFLFLRY